MNQKQISTIKKHLSIRDGQVITTSLDVANFFDKKHKHVLEAVMNLDCPVDFTGPNFRPSSYISEQNKELPMLDITRKGFVLLAMGFTGSRAMEFKIAYIEAFDQMEKGMQRGAMNLQALAAEVLAARPLWRDIKRYKALGLTHVEIGKLLNRNPSTIRRDVRKMEACGIMPPPANLKQLQAKAQYLFPGLEVQS